MQLIIAVDGVNDCVDKLKCCFANVQLQLFGLLQHCRTDSFTISKHDYFELLGLENSNCCRFKFFLYKGIKMHILVTVYA